MLGKSQLANSSHPLYCLHHRCPICSILCHSRDMLLVVAGERCQGIYYVKRAMEISTTFYIKYSRTSRFYVLLNIVMIFQY